MTYFHADDGDDEEEADLDILSALAGKLIKF